MRLPTHLRSSLHLSKPQFYGLGSVVDNGKEAMYLATRTLLGRAALPSDNSSSSESRCKTGDNSPECQKPTDSGHSQTLAIVLGAVIPIICALLVLYFLHRRMRKRQRLEEINDPHKSLDFGVGMAPTKTRGKPRIPEMTITDFANDPMRPGKRPRGLSMDLTSSPYLLPHQLQDSRESIHSISRSMQGEHDPYRPVTLMRSSTESSRPRLTGEAASQYPASTMHSANEKAALIANAQRMSRSDPHGVGSMSSHTSKSSDDLPPRQMHSNRSVPPSRKTSLGSMDQPLTEIKEMHPPRKHSLPQSLPTPPPPPKPPVEQAQPPRTTSSSVSHPPRKSSASTGARSASLPWESSNHGDEQPLPPVPIVNELIDYDVDPSMMSTGRLLIDTPNPSQPYPVQARGQSVMGLRPLPDNLPEDNPEVRANRIRSFYREYFDDSRPNPSHGHYEEDYDAGYIDAAAIYGADTRGFAMPGRPFAEQPGRRAMTPPPRGAPRMQNAHRRQYSTQSVGRPGPRGRPGPPQQIRKKRAPPPKPLQGLPTPHKLKDYDSVISSPIDFAPPASFNQMQNGSRPGTPSGGGSFPYSPTVRAFSPLATAYDELAVMPSPHHLRRSGTFTALDFAPPSRLGAHNDNASDAGSIRSARSGISAMQMGAVRACAYRVSRIPKETVTTRDDLAMQLKPRMDLILPA